MPTAKKIGYHPNWHIKDSPIYINRGLTTENSEVAEGNITFKAHWHDFHELIFIQADSGVHHINDIILPCRKGQVFLILPGDTHWFDPNHPGVELTNILFFPWRVRHELNMLTELQGVHHRLLSSGQEEIESGLLLNLEGTGYGNVRELLDRMLEESDRKHPGYRSVLRALLIQLFTALSRATQHSESNSPAGRIDRLISTFENTFYQVWDMDRMTDLTGMSVSSLNRHFNSRTGYPPIEYLTRLRIKRAKELVQHTDLSFTSIAYQVGFSDSNYFARQFKRVTGMTASTMRSIKLNSPTP